jgi:hypothetical protein
LLPAFNIRVCIPYGLRFIHWMGHDLAAGLAVERALKPCRTIHLEAVRGC